MQGYGSTDFKFITFMIYYSLVLIMLVLNCFADAPPRFSEYPKVDVNSTMELLPEI